MNSPCVNLQSPVQSQLNFFFFRGEPLNINFDIDNELCYIPLSKKQEETWAVFSLKTAHVGG
jgi:hypothetical protein